MEVTAQSQLEKAEVETILSSGIFHRAPNLSSFLTYVCERYFEGAADQIKEYNIAVEALGRPAEFDQKKDSIVRVEAHRLRKRLSEYYASAGADHAVRIVIPNGQYAPRFVAKADSIRTDLQPVAMQEPAQLAAARLEPLQATPEVLHPLHIAAAPKRPKLLRYLVAVGVAAAVLTTIFFLAPGKNGVARSASSPAPDVWKGNSADPVSSEFRMLAGYGGRPFVDRQGHRWEPDAYFNGGRSVPIGGIKTIEGLPDPDLLHGFREGNFRYDIPLRPGFYELHLYFAEVSLSRANPAEGDEVRSFRVNINGQTRLDLFDAASEAGAPNRLQVRVFKDVTPDKDGKLHLEFLGQSGQAILDALEILSAEPGRIRPIRIAARRTPVMDVDGHAWAADEYAVGGHMVERNGSIANLRQKNLFEGERFGNFSYRLPVAAGKYRLTLHFAETYFGSGVPNAPPYANGARLFNVFVNGVALLRNFDIAEAAGGVNRGIERTFEGLEPNAQGLIVVEFIPLRNFACLNAIELQETE